MGEYEKGIQYFQHIVDNWPDYEFAWHAQFFVGSYTERLKKLGKIPAEGADPVIEQAYRAVIEKNSSNSSLI